MTLLSPNATGIAVAVSRKAVFRRLWPLLLGIFVNAATLHGQQSGGVAQPDPGVVATLLQRIEQLEATQKQLQERVAQLETGQAAAGPELRVAPSPPGPIERAQPANAPSATAPSVSTAVSSSEAAGQGEVTAPERVDDGKQLLTIRGFGDYGLQGQTQKGTTTSFSLGQIDFFIASNLSDRFRFVTDLVFEKGVGNDYEEDLERVLLEYRGSDYFKLDFGRNQTAIGYYNLAFRHSSWWQTTTRRPYLFLFEDEGGILPGHIVGASASGEIPSGKMGLHYIAEVGNGRASSPGVEPVQNFVDENNHKAVDVNVFARPEAVPGLRVGFSAYRDLLEPPNSPRVGETILDTYVVLVRSKWEWLNEGMLIQHTPQGLSHVFNTSGFYSQISRGFGSFRPYFRYQYVNAPNNEPIFFPVYDVSVGLQYGPTVGVRYDFTESVAAKLEYEYNSLRRVQGITQPSISQLGMQLTFAF
jgi:hypothetical protein